MAPLESELADLLAQIKRTQADSPERPALIESQRRLCDLMALLG
jgi:hypothetical protein